MAQAFHHLGCAVTVLEATAFLARDDRDAARLVVDTLRAQGIRLLAPVTIREIHTAQEKIAVTISHGDGQTEMIEASHLLIAAGRQPRVDGLDLEVAGITTTARGICVDAGLRTSNRRVYAIGDVTGGLQFTHMANYHAGLVIRSALFRLPVRERRSHVPWVTYTEPELAQVGLTEAQARHADAHIQVLTWPFADNDRAQAEHAQAGFVKVMADRRGRVKGATIVGAQAGELIQIWALMIANGLKLSHLAATILPYPTRGEASKRAAISAYAKLPQKPALRRLLDVLAWFG
jgi:pyruvate/2-oxoglutarate dehydrogenase complex dihydrolipoamide dehydrogenase (E3) component